MLFSVYDTEEKVDAVLLSQRRLTRKVDKLSSTMERILRRLDQDAPPAPRREVNFRPRPRPRHHLTPDGPQPDACDAEMDDSPCTCHGGVCTVPNLHLPASVVSMAHRLVASCHLTPQIVQDEPDFVLFAHEILRTVRCQHHEHERSDDEATAPKFGDFTLYQAWRLTKEHLAAFPRVRSNPSRVVAHPPPDSG